MRRLSTGLLLVAAAINLAPALGAFSVERMSALYGIPIEGADLELLMRHRALLFGIVGSLLTVAAWRRSLRPLAAAVGFASMLSFVAIAGLVGDVNEALQRVVLIDVVGIVALGASVLIDRRA